MKNSIQLIEKTKLLALSLFVVVATNACSGDSDSKKSSSANCDSAPDYTLLTDEEFATIPASIAGTYTLTYGENATGSGIADGAEVEFEVKEDGSLIIDGTTALCNPILYKANAHEAIWKDEENDLAYALSSLTLGFNEINVSNNVHYDQGGFVYYGQFGE